MTSEARRTWPFFLLTFVLTWGLQIPAVLAQRGVLPGPSSGYLVLAGLGMLGPMMAAIVLTRREGGSVGELFATLFRWRVPVRFYVAALLPAVLLTGLLFLLNLAGRTGPMAYVPVVGGVVFGIVASIVEEVGWRRFALPRLQARWGSFAASGLLGVVWYLWHLPMFAGQGVPQNLFLVMLLHFVGGSLLLTWIYNGTGGSLLLVSLAHLAAHLNNSHRALPEVVPLVAHAIVYAALGLFVMRKVLGRNQSGGHPQPSGPVPVWEQKPSKSSSTGTRSSPTVQHA